MTEDKNVKRAAALDTATLSDALDKLGIAGQCIGIKPLDSAFRLTGRAYTIRYGAIDAEKPGTVGDYIDDVPADAVLLLDNAGRPDATVWGDILTLVASKRGLQGTVIEGACRDISLALEIRYPLFSRHVSMRTGKDRVQVDEVNGIITVGGVRVRALDLVRGDADGIVVIPRGRESDVLATAEAIAISEDAIREHVTSGMRLDEARKKLRYHKLQSAAS